MINLLFLVIFLEMALIMALLFKTPLRKLVIMGLDRLKGGRGPLMVKSVAGTLIVVLLSTVYTMMKIHKRGIENGAANPTDQVLMARHLLEATLMGFVIFLVFMVDRLHHYIRELRMRRKNMEAIKKQTRGHEDEKIVSPDEKKALEEESDKSREELKRLESELVLKTADVKVAEANAVALRKQSEGFLLEYDRLLEENRTSAANVIHLTGDCHTQVARRTHKEHIFARSLRESHGTMPTKEANNLSRHSLQ